MPCPGNILLASASNSVHQPGQLRACSASHRATKLLVQCPHFNTAENIWSTHRRSFCKPPGQSGVTVSPPLRAQAENAVRLQTVQQVTSKPGNTFTFLIWRVCFWFFNLQACLNLLKSPEQTNKTNLHTTTVPHVALPWLCPQRYQFKLNWILGDTFEKNSAYSDFIKGKLCHL